MRILHIDPDDVDNPLSGGGPVRTLEICRRLAKRHEVTVLTPTFPGSTPELVRDGVRYVRLGGKVRNHGSSHHITFFFSIPAAVRRLHYDLLVEDFMPPASVTLNPLFSKAPVVASVQWFFAETLARQYRLPFHWGERHGLRLYKNFIVLSQQMKALIERRAPEAKIEVIGNGISDVSLFALPIQHGNFILYLGRIDLAQKGLDLLLRAFSKLPHASRIPLVLAGHGYEQDAVIDQIKQLGLESMVSLAGRVDSEQRRKLLQECRFVCVPSRSETFGMVITEACAAGKRVVAFDLPPINEVTPDGPCKLVPPFHVEAYASAMAELLNCDLAKLISEGLRCREWARRYQWDELARQQEAFYFDVVERSYSVGGSRREKP